MRISADRRRLDASALRLLHRRRGALSRHHDRRDAVLRRAEARATRGMRRAWEGGRWISISWPKTFVRLLAALPLTLSALVPVRRPRRRSSPPRAWMRLSGNPKPFELVRARLCLRLSRHAAAGPDLPDLLRPRHSAAAVRASLVWPFLREPFWCAVLALTLNTAGLSGGDLPRRAAGGAARTGRGGARLRHVGFAAVPPHHLPDRAAPGAAGLFDRDHPDGEGDVARLAHHDMGGDRHRPRSISQRHCRSPICRSSSPAPSTSSSTSSSRGHPGARVAPVAAPARPPASS